MAGSAANWSPIRKIGIRGWRSLATDVAVVVAFTALACAPLVIDDARKAVDLSRVLTGPGLSHPLGTDTMGRDLLARLGAALWTAVLPLWGVALLGMAGGAALGLLRIVWMQKRGLGRVLRAFDGLSVGVGAVPVGIAALAWAAYWGEAGLFPVAAALVLLFAVRFYNLIRSHYQQDHRLSYWQAHEALGGPTGARIWRHGLVTGWRWRIFDAAGFHLKAAVAIEASLSFLGFGIQEPHPSFGNILSSHFDLYLKGQPQIPLLVVLALALSASFPSRGFRLAARLAQARHMGAPVFGPILQTAAKPEKLP